MVTQLWQLGERREIMYLIRLTVVLFICIAVSGCFGGQSTIHDYELYDNGKPKKAAESYFYEESFHKDVYFYSHSSEYFENGHLKSEEWSQGNEPVCRLEFYENGQLKSEERFYNGKLVYGVYYSETGQVERTTGSLMNWVTRKNL